MPKVGDFIQCFSKYPMTIIEGKITELRYFNKGKDMLVIVGKYAFDLKDICPKI